MAQHNVPGHLWNAQHKLERVRIDIDLRDPEKAGEIGLHAQGLAETSRHSLWHYNEAFTESHNLERGYGVGDAVHHIVLVAIQDRPSRLDALELALRGGVSWSQGPMF